MSIHICAKSLALLRRPVLVTSLPFKSLVPFRRGSDHRADTAKVLMVWAPEIIEDEPSNNPALIIPRQEEDMIRFNDMTPVMVLRAFLKNVTLFDAAIEEITSDSQAAKKLEMFDSIDSHLMLMRYIVSLTHTLTYNNPKEFKYRMLDDMYKTFQKHEVARFNSKTYQVAQQLSAETKQSNNDDHHHLAENYLLNGKFHGLQLNQMGQAKVADFHQKIQSHVNKFIDNVNKSIYKEAVYIGDETVVKALPESLVHRTMTKTGLKLPLHTTVYNMFMATCNNKNLRHKFWTAYHSKPQMGVHINNSVEFEKLRDVRHQLAETLGYSNYVEMSMEKKMAGSLEVARTTINTIFERTRPRYYQDLKALEESKGRSLIGKIDLWDLSYLQALADKKRFGSKLEVSRYFPLHKVVIGTFEWLSNLFGIQIEKVSSDKCQKWSRYTRFFRVREGDQVLGHFYFDPFCQRLADYYGSNTIELTNRCKNLGTTPLITAFLAKKAPLAADQEILLNYQEFLSFLSMMGRILTPILTKRNYFELSSSVHIPIDRLDVLGYTLLLYGINDYKLAEKCSANITDGEPLPAKTHELLRQQVLAHMSIGLTQTLFLSALDLVLYANNEFWKEIIVEVWQKYMAPFSLPKEYAYPISFIDIVTDTGAAGYYCKIWSQMIGSDVYQCFKEYETEGSGENKAARKFKDIVLASGSTYNGVELFRQFRGRDPSVAPFLELHDLIAEENTPIQSQAPSTALE